MEQTWTPPQISRGDAVKRMTLPSWFASVVCHGLLLLLFLLSLQHWDSGNSGATENDFREVGIYVKNAADQAETADAEKTSDHPAPEENQLAEDRQPSEAEVATAATESLPELPSDLLELPETEIADVVGAGSPLKQATSASAADALTGLEGAPSPTALLSAAHGQTSFFDIKVEGTKFVYLVDRSGSMGDYRQLAVAKRELLASINSLDSTQQFHVLFYNNTYEQLTISGKPPGLQWATDINKTLAGQFIKRMTPEGGTTHLPALMKALSYRAEHLYFLTDATEPLSAAALDDIRQYNRGRTQIHCVEFGKGGDLALDNYLKRLARQNGGTYRYRDVRSF
ncbi:hypothetical protein GC176_23015 [bacterium]|nr:hypothetical protein [bacterium]